MKVLNKEQIVQEFRRRLNRQLFAISLTFLLLIFLVLVYRRSDLFGVFSSRDISAVQVITIIAFIGFSAWNWRCPSCGKYLGKDIDREACRNCGARLR